MVFYRCIFPVVKRCVHPNTFIGQRFRVGSVCSPDPDVRQSTVEHLVHCVSMARETKSRTIGIWLADGTNYPGQDHLRDRKRRMLVGLGALYAAMDAEMTLLVEYKFLSRGSARRTLWTGGCPC